MRKSAVRLIPLFLVLVSGSGTQVSALAHGYAHQREADHHAPASSAQQRHAADVRELEAADHPDGDHGHPAVGVAVTAQRLTHALPLPPARVALPVVTVVVVGEPQTDPVVRPPGDLAHAPPPRLRAPPAFSA